jgi:hypothetical protein
MAEGTEPIADDELLYRRIPVSKGWYDAHGVSPEAFDPREDETTGISVYRAKHKSIEDAAKGMSKKGYYVAVLRVGDLRQHGIQVVLRPEAPSDLAHAELPDLTCHNRSTPEAEECKLRLTDICLRVEGPFHSTTGTRMT